MKSYSGSNQGVIYGRTSGAGRTIINVANCRLTDTTTGLSNSYCDGVQFWISSDVDLYIWNSIIEGFNSGTSHGLDNDDTGCNIYAANCIIKDCKIGIRRNNGGVTIENSMVFNNSVNNFTGTMTIDHCATDAGTGTNPQTPLDGDWNKELEDFANGDCTLLEDANCRDTGIDDPFSGKYSTDMDGDTWESPWSIGVDQYYVPPVPTTGDKSYFLLETKKFFITAKKSPLFKKDKRTFL